MSRNVYRNYQSHIRKLNRTGTWYPGDLLKIGEVGKLRDGCFFRAKTLAELGIDYHVEEGSVDEVFNRASATEIDASAGAKLGVQDLVEGGLNFDFDKQGKFVLSARNLRHQRIENIGHVCDQIIRYHQLGKWDPAWVLVDQVWTADYLAVLLAESRKARGAVVAKSGELAGLGSLSDAQLELDVVQKSGDIWFARGPDKTPFFTGRKLKRRWFRDNETEQISTRPEAEFEDDVLALDFMDDLMNSWSESTKD